MDLKQFYSDFVFRHEDHFAELLQESNYCAVDSEKKWMHATI